MNLRLLLVANLIAVIACDQIGVNHSHGEEEPNGKRSQRKGKKPRRNKKKEKWVVDSIFYDDYQSDGPSPTEIYDFCPPVPDVIDEDACAKDTCKSDRDCSESYRCCFNGCSYSCLYEVQPAAVVDWLKEPRRSRSGISWLMPDKKPVKEEAETCTTGPFESDEDPLLCPHGYFCYVDSENINKKKKQSKKGHCVKQADDHYSPGEAQMALTAALKGRSICHVDGIVLLDGASLRLTDKQCNCRRGFLSCVDNSSRSGQVDMKITSKNPDREKRRKDRRRRKRKKNKRRGEKANRS